MEETLDDNSRINGKGLSFNGAVQGYLRGMSGWSVIISIFVFLLTISQIIAGAYNLWFSVQLEDTIFNAEAKTHFVMMGWIYMIVGLLLVLPGLYFVRFSINIRRAFRTTDQGDLEFAIRNLRNLFVFGGSYAILVFILIAVILFSAFAQAS